ncbi:uncharacterized protein UV8b_01814 [Ustilaginoidea virens]|uniref:Uncharacterized protein n=1 Tax=Ustilaginoidea virens TaxID=1159556 RepID=A0A8E5HLM7_USTVR|nr:uncharacterized protein UV8b_01814 [Ustilaginoidea virens]QUC17573.1 hypothetical protein UV8b_01814 [Ustilaginoidea virens]
MLDAGQSGRRIRVQCRPSIKVQTGAIEKSRGWGVLDTDTDIELVDWRIRHRQIWPSLPPTARAAPVSRQRQRQRQLERR